MEFRIFMEWDKDCGLSLEKMYPLVEGIENGLVSQSYGTSISKIVVIMTCMAKNVKQRKRYKKDTRGFEYDILLDYLLIKNIELEEKKKLICYQMTKITEETFSKYKFEDFDKGAFLSDFKEIVNKTKW
jgi:hypothetical protein